MTAKKRGRPPTGKARTGSAERVRKYRAAQRAKLDALKASGGSQLDLVLDRDAVNALMVCIGAHQGLTVSQLVSQLLEREARFLQGVESELQD